MPPHYRGFVITLRHTTVGRTPLDEWSARRRDLYITTLTRDKHPCPRRNSNPQSQEAIGRRPTPYTARPLGGFLMSGWPKAKGNFPQYATWISCGKEPKRELVLKTPKETHIERHKSRSAPRRSVEDLNQTSGSSHFKIIECSLLNPLALELDTYSLAHHLCKMWIFYEPRRITLGNTRHFVEE